METTLLTVCFHAYYCKWFHSVKINKLLTTKSNRKGVPIHDGQSGLPKCNLVWSCLHLSLRLLLRLRGEHSLLDLELLLVEGESAAVAEAQRRAVRHPRRAVRRRHALTCILQLLLDQRPLWMQYLARLVLVQHSLLTTCSKIRPCPPGSWRARALKT